VTNGNSDVARTPLGGLFHHSLSATDVGAQKPNPALFRAALKWAALDPAQALHAGDDPHRDVQAARDVGMGAVWVNRSGGSWPEDLEPPAAEVTDMRAFKDWLDGAERGV
jgi:putative hydrolase of the HAD superfamily